MGAPPPRSGARIAFPRRDCWSGSDPEGSGQGCANTPAPEPVAGPWTAGSLPTTRSRPACHGRPGGGAARRCCACGWTGTPVRIAGGPKCASDPHVVCALRYGSKSRRGLPSNPTSELQTLGGRCGHARPATRSASEDGAGNRVGSDDGGQSVGRPTGDNYGVRSGRVSAALRQTPPSRSSIPDAGSSGLGSQVCSLAVMVSICQPLSVSLKCISYRTPPHPYSRCMYPIPTETL